MATPNPYTYEGVDNAGRRISISISWAAVLRTISGATTHRDAGCLFTKILIGVGVDGRPDSTTTAMDVATGDTAVLVTWFTLRGLTTIDQVIARQITAGR